MADAESDFIFGGQVDRNLENLLISLAFDDFYGAEVSLSNAEKYLIAQGKPFPEDYARLAHCVAELAVPALTAQAQDLYEMKEYFLALATLEYLHDFCEKLKIPLPEAAGDLVGDLSVKELPVIPDEYQGDVIIAFFRVPDGQCMQGVFNSPACAYKVIKQSGAACMGVFAGVNDDFISEAVMRTWYFTYNPVDKISLSDILIE